MGGLTAGTCSGIWTWIKWKDKVSMVACTATLMGMVLVNMNLCSWVFGNIVSLNLYYILLANYNL